MIVARIVLLLPALSLVSCVGFKANKDTQKNEDELDWNDLISANHLEKEEIANRRILDPRFYDLPRSIQMRPKLALLALNSDLEDPVFYGNGVYGKRDHAVHFITTTNRIPGWKRLYWIMVKVLSEKYGCFMKAKYKWRKKTAFICRDDRIVIMWLDRGRNWIRFFSRQFDREGRELIVENHKVVGRRRPGHLSARTALRSIRH